MTRLATIILALVSLAAALGPSAASARPGGAGAAPPRSQLRGYACHRVLDPARRSIEVRAVMRPRPGTRRLALKFDLLVRRHRARESAIRKGDLGAWISPASPTSRSGSPASPTLGRLTGDVWKVDKSVVELAAPAGYRLRVSFHWIGAAGRVIGSAVRYTPRCRQRELRPDLLVSAIAVAASPAQARQDLYTATVTNAGATTAGPFDVLFAPGDKSDPTTLKGIVLGPHQSRTVTFAGPLCAVATAPTITADPARHVDDLNRANNGLTAACPAPGSL